MLSPRINAILVVVVLIAGMFGGWKYEHDKLVTYKATVDQAGKDQVIQTREKEKENDAQTLIVANAYVADHERLMANIKRLHNTISSYSTLPKVSDSTQSPYGEKQEQCGALESTEFYSNALEDALKLHALQDWIIRQRIPVGD